MSKYIELVPAPPSPVNLMSRGCTPKQDVNTK